MKGRAVAFNAEDIAMRPLRMLDPDINRIAPYANLSLGYAAHRPYLVHHKDFEIRIRFLMCWLANIQSAGRGIFQPALKHISAFIPVRLRCDISGPHRRKCHNPLLRA